MKLNLQVKPKILILKKVQFIPKEGIHIQSNFYPSFATCPQMVVNLIGGRFSKIRKCFSLCFWISSNYTCFLKYFSLQFHPGICSIYMSYLGDTISLKKSVQFLNLLLARVLAKALKMLFSPLSIFFAQIFHFFHNFNF